MSTKWLVSIVATVFLLCGVDHPPISSAQTRPLIVRMGTSAPRDTSPYQELKIMAEKWRKAPGGGADLIISNPQGDEAETVQRIRSGQYQAAMLSVTGLSEIDPSVKALEDLPFVFHSLDEVEYVRKNLTPDIHKKFLDKGFVVLFWGDVGWVRFFSTEKMIHPADLKKMKIFTWAGDSKQADIMRAAGFNPVSLPSDAILQQLGTGQINVIPTAPLIADAGQFYGKAKHMLEINYAPLVGGAVITKTAWDSIPKASQDALRKAAQEAGEALTRRGRAESDASVTAMKTKGGLIVDSVTPEIESEWRDLAKTFYPKLRGGIVPADLFDRVMNLLDEYRATKGASK